MAEQVRAHRAAQPVAEPTRIVLRPTAVDDAGFTVEPDPELPGGFIVRGDAAGALDPADRLRQRRGRRLPRRPAGPARRRGRAGRGGRGAGLPGHHRRRHVRLGAVHARPASRSCSPGAARTGGWTRARARRRADRKAARVERRRHHTDEELLSEADDTWPGRAARDCPGAARGGPPGRGQGRLVVADQPRRRARPAAAGRPGRRARRPARGRQPGRAGVLRRDRGRARPARAGPPPARPRHPAGRRRRRAAAARAGLRRVVRPLRAHRSARCCSPRTT